MALKNKYANAGEVPAELKSFYLEQGGEWVLEHDGKAKLDEFRSGNIALNQQMAEWKKRFEGIDPDAVRQLADEKRKLEEAAQLKAGEVDNPTSPRPSPSRCEPDWPPAGRRG